MPGVITEAPPVIAPPVPDLDQWERAALDFVNELRYEYASLPPIERLPRGKPGDARRCPIACGLGFGDAAVDSGTVSFLRDGFDVEVKDGVCEFITLFDAGDYPHLIDDTYSTFSAILLELRAEDGF